jgi:hypothetical protein
MKLYEIVFDTEQKKDVLQEIDSETRKRTDIASGSISSLSEQKRQLESRQRLMG